MYKVVIVDDEYWGLKGVINSFPWKEYSFEVCHSTTNPLEAYEVIKKENVDVVFSDIRMPAMTGIELCTRLAEEGYHPLFVFVSGYNEYEYIRNAIINGAFDYCLKPIDEDDAQNVLIRLKKKLDASSQPKKDSSHEYQIDNMAFKGMIDYINENYTQRLNLNDLAKKFYINPNYCCQLFKKYINMSFSSYVNELRIEKAIEIMNEEPVLSTEAISELVGYSNYSHFCKRFKKKCGVSPTKFRKGNRNKQALDEE